MSDLQDHDQPRVPDPGLLTLSALAFVGFVTILVTVSLSGGVDTFDSMVASRAGLARGTSLTVLARLVTALGSFPAVGTLAAVAVVGLWIRTRQLWTPAILASSVAATAGLVTLLKIAVGRPRPDVGTLLGSPAADYSFPSGHTTNATLLYVLAALLLTAGLRPVWRRLAIGAAVLLALLIGLSRIYLGYHWVTDVLAGWLLAVGIIAASYFTARRLGPQDGVQASVTPDQTVVSHPTGLGHHPVLGHHTGLGHRVRPDHPLR